MRKLKLFLSCLLMAVLSIGQMWGAESLYKTASFAKANCTKNSSYTGSVTCTIGTDSWTAAYAANNNGGWDYIKMGGKRPSTGGSTVHTGTIITSASYSDAITKVVVNGSLDRGSVSAKLIYASNSDFTSDMVESDALVAFTDGKMTFTIASPVADRYYKLEFVCTNATTTNGVIAISSVEYYIETTKTLVSIAVSGDPEKTSYYEGDNFDPAGLVVTGTYSDDSHEEITSDITWSYNPAQELALNQTSIGVIATVDNIESAEFTVSSLSVTEAPAAVEYVKFTGDIEEGDYVIYYSGKAMKNTVASNRLSFEEVTPVNDKIKNPSEAIVWHIAPAATEGYWTIYNADIEKYLVCTGSNNQANLNASTDNALVSVVEVSEGNFNFLSKARQDAGSNNYYLRENGTYGYAFYGSGTGGVPTLYKKIDGTEKQAAGLAYDAADQKKLVKFGDAFIAPTLSNPNNLEGITYESNNTDVAEVAANGAVTIKAAGVAVITASFAGNDDYKAGSASYTIGVTTHAGTEADPYVAADAKIAIDAMGTVENAYATGVVSNVVTTTLPQDGYITFYFSADGTTTDQVEAYKCYGLNSAAFEAVSDVVTGATVVVTGNLKKYNSTYEFDQNCHLVSYEAPAVPKTHIANAKETAYTVAQAITFAADGVTYDLDDYVYVQGVVYDVKSFSEGVMNIFIKDANAENQFELYKCAGINDGSATTPFEALTDVQAGNIVIGYGQLTVYNTTYEFKQGNYLVDLQKPVTGIELNATAEVEEGSTVNLTATILPSNATGTIDWTVEAGSEYASVDAGVVTGIAEGEALIRATVQGTEIYAECTVTVTPASAPASYDYALVTDAAQLQDGLKVIIVAAEADKAAGSAAATYRNVVDVERTTDGNYLILDGENMPTEFTLGVPAAGQYTFHDGDGYMYESAAKSVKVQADPFNWSITIGEGNIATIQATNELRYNNGNPRFTTYASGQQALQLYVKNDGKQAAGLAWSANTVELTVGDEFEAPTLTNPNNLTVTIASNNPELAIVEGGVVSLVESATGTAIITASYAGDDTYRAASVSYTITVNAAEPPTPPTYDYALVTDAAQLQDGLKVIIVAANEDKAAGSAAATYRNVVDVERTSEGDYLILDSENMPTEFTLGVPAAGQYTFNDGDGYMYENAAKSVKVQADPFNWSITIGEGNIATIQATNELRYNSGSPRFTTYASGQQALQLYVKDDGKQAAGLAWSASAVELTVGDEFTAPSLTNPNNLTVTIESNNTELAVVNEGVVSLVSEATGTATITATYAGDDTYRATSVSYIITVNEAVVPPTPLPDAEAKVIVVEYNSKFYAMSTTVKNGTGFEPIEVEKEGGKIIVKTNEEAAAIQWMMAVGESVATFQNGDSKYLACGSNSNTELALLDAVSEWAWDADANCYKQPGKDSKGRTFYYNYNSGNPIFRAYTVNGIGAEGYSGAPEFIAAENIEVHPDYGSYNRDNLTPGNYATICLPNGGTIEGAKLFDLEYYDGASTLYLLEVNGNAMVAGRPYIFLPSGEEITVTYTGNEGADAGSFNGLVGSYTEEIVAIGTGDEANYILYQNAYYLVNSQAKVGANRAYIHMAGVPTEPSTPQVGQAPRRRVAMNVNGTNGATGFENINATEKPMKLMINGQIYILRGEKMYDATGRMVK